MTCDDDAYSTVIRQTAHEAVCALLTAPPDSAAGSLALREVTEWLATEHGDDAVRDLAEELATDLAEALDALADAEARPALVVLDSWFHDVPQPPSAIVATAEGEEDHQGTTGEHHRGATP